MALMLPMLGFAQGNGGISNENTSTKIEWVGIINGSYVVKVTNKQSCQVDMRVQWNGSTQSNSKQISPISSDTFWMPSNPASGGFLRAKPEIVCDSRGDIGVVELNINRILPVKFTSITGQRVGAHSVKLIFTAEEDSNTDHYNIQYSLDGKIFKTVNVIFPNGVVGGKQYSVIVNY